MAQMNRVRNEADGVPEVGSRAHPLQLESSAWLALKDFSQDRVTRGRTPTTNGEILCEITFYGSAQPKSVGFELH